MSCATEIAVPKSASLLFDDRGQATIEAAFVLPVLMLLFLMLLQPGLVFYDHMVMSGAAAEGCRLLAASPATQKGICEDFIRRRLSAIPQADFFHIHGGGCSYEIEFAGDESSETVTVRISNMLKPLPLMDMTMALAGITDESGAMSISVESTTQTQPSWVDESSDGRDPSKWVQI